MIKESYAILKTTISYLLISMGSIPRSSASSKLNRGMEYLVSSAAR